MYKLVVTVHSVWMPVGFVRGMKGKGLPLSVMAQLKRILVEVNAEGNCLGHALMIAKAKLENFPNYKAYRECRKLRPVVRILLDTTFIDLSISGGSLNNQIPKTL